MTTWLLRLSTHDERALHVLVVRRRGWIDRAMRTITLAGDAYFTIPAAALLLAASATLLANHVLLQ